VHVQGKKLYEWNRDQVRVTSPPRTVHVESISVVRFSAGKCPRALVDVRCSKGTYVRSLAHDLGQEIGCGAYLSFLVRTAVGPFDLPSANTLESLAAAESPERLLLPMAAAVEHLPTMALKERGVARSRSGMTLEPQDIAHASSASHGELVALMDPEGRLIALGEFHQVARHYFVVKPTKVLQPQ
jgi:tRNA pseudouridine55 synthase